MATGTSSRRALVQDDASALSYAGRGLAGVGLLLVVVALLLVFKAVTVTTPVAGVPLYVVLGAVTALAGAALAACGAASRLDAVESEPDRSAGLVTGAAFGVAGLVGGAVFGAGTLDLAVLWPVPALVVGAGMALLAMFPREDVGSTLPAGLVAVVSGVAVASGVVGPDWTWGPIPSSATFTGAIAIPVLVGASGLLLAWLAARASEGFGTRGKQTGAYLLIGTNAAGMLALLAILVAFIASKGVAPATEGIRFGLFWRPIYWFYVQPLGEYVVIHGPVLWFYWPFAMEGVSLTNQMNGVAPAIIGTVWLVVGAIVVSVPLGVGAAVFLTEYAEQGRFTQLIEVSTNGLWSTPSIVYGLFGLAFLVPRLGNSHSLLAGQLVLGAMMLPLVVITSREAIKNVPDEYRDASAALGVSQWETIKSVVVPAAMPGVITGVILGVGRIAGETAPILLVMVGEPFPTDGPTLIHSQTSVVGLPFTGTGLTLTYPFVNSDVLLQPASALPYQLYAIITAGLGTSTGVDDPTTFAWGTALVLLVVVLGFYAVGIASRIYFRRKLQA